LYKSLRDFVETDRQAEILEACIECGSNKKAAEVLDINRRTVDKTITRIKVAKAKRQTEFDNGEIRQHKDGFSTERTTEQYGANGELQRVWVKTKADKNEQVVNFLDEFKSKIPKAKIVPASKPANSELLNLYTITDYHLGMLSWKEETGADWDTDLAVDTLIQWFAAAIKASPQADECIFCELGDFEHYDGLDSVTPLHKHVLDSDTRMVKLIRSSLKVNRTVIQMLLKKYQIVHVIIAEGNHNLTGSAWRREAFAMHYEDEPRVNINTEVKPYYAQKFGNNALFFSHGHVKKMGSIDTVFAGLFPEIFGQTKKRYAHMGHLHHDKVLESNLMRIEQHRTLAAPDAYAIRGGWLSERDAKVITYHKEYGEVDRRTLSFDYIQSV